MRAAATLLAASGSSEGLRAALAAAGFNEEAVPLPADTRAAFGFGEGQSVALLAAGALRALVFDAESSSLREEAQRIARRVATHAPHVPWLFAARDQRGHAVIAALVAGTRGRLAAFRWEPAHVVDSDAETLCALAAVARDAGADRHARCVEVLGRDALTRRFYRALEQHVGRLAAAAPARLSAADAREMALLSVTRLLFLRFLEAKGWIDADRRWLSSRFDACMRSGGGFHRRVLLPLFFGTLNTPARRRAPAARALGRIPFLNGGLFARAGVERRGGSWWFPDDALGALFADVFERYRFVAREDTATWSEASVDPEMLGRAFECLMSGDERRRGGVFYTPHALVERVADAAIEAAIPAPTMSALRTLRVLDPACGSGAFLVHVLERLAGMRQALGDPATVPELRREVLARSVFGVDRNPTAVWLCELRLWLSVVIESDEADPMRVPPLPNLDRNIRVGDTIAGASFDDAAHLLVGGTRIERLRAAYVRATGRRKQGLARTLDRYERQRALELMDRQLAAATWKRRDLLCVARARDLFGERPRPTTEGRQELTRLRDGIRELRRERRRIADGGALPFSFSTCFAEVQARGGFDLVVGNPPWVRIHRIPEQLRRRFREVYAVVRAASWQPGALAGGAGSGFASQVDLAALFVERSLAVARDGGALALLLPAKLWRALAGGGVRRLVSERARLMRLEDLSESRHCFDAAVYPSLLVARVREGPAALVRLAVHRRDGVRRWDAAMDAIAFDDSPGAPWLMLRPEARSAFDRLRAAGTPLARSAFGAPRLGVKSGCNAAFLVRVTDSRRGIASVVDADGETGAVELALLRPALRGDAVRAWQRAPCDEWIVWTHDESGAPARVLPPRARAWLGRRYGTLAARSDGRRTRRWWSLFRTDAADARSWRVVWADIGRRPRAAVLEPGDPTVPLNSCYVLRCGDAVDAWAIAALLNSPLAAAWINAVAEPARGGYRRYLGWTIGLLPLPAEWPRARHVLAEAARTADPALHAATLDAYGLRRGEVASLLEPECDG